MVMANANDHVELALLQDTSSIPGGMNEHESKTAVVFTRDAFILPGMEEALPQRGVLGTIVETFGNSKEDDRCQQDPRLYINTNAPFSALVCGVQGSGKSHTVSVLLENMLIGNHSAIGNLKRPLSGLVLHFGDGGAFSQPCEAAWLALRNAGSAITPPKVRVFVSKSSMKTMAAVYAPLGGAVTVEPLQFSKSELDAQAFLSLMAVGASNSMPLYMHTIISILRQLGEDYTFEAFMRELERKKQDMVPTQTAVLTQRMDLLNSFLDKTGRSTPSRFVAGQLTIVDLSDPFIDTASACAVFEILVRLFVRAKVSTGKVLVVDEAHKYLSGTAQAGLTKELASLVRQQRHQGMRVIISTQEPTVVPPVLLDLCPLMILHRFTSRRWWDHVAAHAAADVDDKQAFDRIVNLQTGQAVVIAPSGLQAIKSSSDENGKNVTTFARQCLVLKTRQRVTKDGGASILAIKL